MTGIRQRPVWPLCLMHCKLKKIILILKSDYGSFLSRIASEDIVCTFVQAQMCQSRSVPSSTKTQQIMIGKCNSREITSCQFVYNPFPMFDLCPAKLYPGNTGTLFPLLMFSLWYLQMIGYIMACRSCSFVCRLHHLIIIIMQTYLKALNY